MSLDVANLAGAVVRTVEKREHLGKQARVVVANVTYNTDIDDLWDAITSAERLPRWFLPVTGDLWLGGRYQLKGNAGGVITECEAPRRLALTWEFGGGVTWLNVNLAPENDGRATLTLEHIAEVTDEIWNQYGPGAVGVGWDLALRALGTHLTTGEPVDPAEAQAWLSTAEGKAFVAASSTGWCEASIASGTPRPAAEAAAAATTGFYTGTDPA
jgi:uncharacterized protein YndB with AHSA1/START domain